VSRASRTALAAAFVLATLAGARAQQPVFRAGSDTVRVFVTVTDRDGRLATALRREDFEVRDEGKPQPLTAFDNTPQPIRLVVMLDVSGSMEGNLSLLRAASDALFARLGRGDVARVGSFGFDVVISPQFTADPGALRAELPRDIAPDAPTPLWRAVDAALSASAEAREQEGRAVVLVLSDGKDSGPLSFRQRYVSQADVIDRARREDVMVYGIGLHSRTSRRGPPGIGPGGLQAALMADLPDPGLALVAQHTGGGYIELRPNQDLGAAFEGVIDELHSQYLLGFTPPRRDGKVHDIEVRVAGKGLKPRARKSYVAPRDAAR
jgi:Ca-activated chloride channel family protein